MKSLIEDGVYYECFCECGAVGCKNKIHVFSDYYKALAHAFNREEYAIRLIKVNWITRMCKEIDWRKIPESELD